MSDHNSDSDKNLNRREALKSFGGMSLAGVFAYYASGCPVAAAADKMAIANAGAIAALPKTDAEIETTAETVINTLEAAYGTNKGLRRNHTKGVGALGYFTGTKQGAELSRSALFAGERIEVVARFSLAGGNPNASDAEKSARGLALEFRLPGGDLHHITMLHTPMFFAKQPETFRAKFAALIPDATTGKPEPARLAQWKHDYPESAGQNTFLADFNPPPSYANCAFYGIHTFKFIDKNDKVTMVRFRFVPHDGEKHLTDSELHAASDNFLENALAERLKKSSANWDMLVAIGEAGDSEDDPTILWPKNRREVKVGTLSLHSSTADPRAGSYKINFDPMMLADGIAATNDPILQFRSPSYVISHTRRLRDL